MRKTISATGIAFFNKGQCIFILDLIPFTHGPPVPLDEILILGPREINVHECSARCGSFGHVIETFKTPEIESEC
jgi:hypothetical protein